MLTLNTNEHVYSPYRQKHTKYTQDSSQIHKTKYTKKIKQKNNQSVSSLTCSTYRPTRIINTFIDINDDITIILSLVAKG